MSSALNKCPKNSKIVIGHHMGYANSSDIPVKVRPISIIIDRNNLDRLTIIDSETKVREVWFFHNGGVLNINNGLETFADFSEATIYTRPLGSQGYQLFLCSKTNILPECPDIGLPKVSDKPHSFLDNLSYNKVKSNVTHSSKKNEDLTTVIPLSISGHKGFHIPKPIKHTSNNKNSVHNASNKPEWIPDKTSIIINGITLKSGLIYIGEPNPGDSDWMMSPAVINLRSPVNMSQPDVLARSVGYWPSYSKTTPEARAAYLSWLASPRDNSEDPISWVFLFFMGLERRVIIDTKRDGNAILDLPSIKNELLRLRSIYGEHTSFNKYSEGLCHLIDLLSIPIPEETLIGNTQDKDRHPWWLRIKLGKLARSQTPLPADLGLAWAKTHPRFTLPKPAIRCSSEFEALFNIRYREKYGFGLVLPDLKQKLIFTYKPATAGMEVVSIDTALPDVSRSIKVDNALNQLIQSCAKELDKYSRFLARNPDGKGTLKAIQLLPEELLSIEEKNILLEAAIPKIKSKKKDIATEIVSVTPVVLDHTLIALKEAETKEVSSLLHSILSDDSQIVSNGNDVKVGLIGSSEKHWSLLVKLGTKTIWERIDYVNECKNLDLMPNGALDTLNEAALAYANEPLTDGEDIINIDQEIFEEMIK